MDYINFPDHLHISVNDNFSDRVHLGDRILFSSALYSDKIAEQTPNMGVYHVCPCAYHVVSLLPIKR